MTILLLAGTGEAKEIAKGLGMRNVPAIASLAGATRFPGALGLPTRIGGFGGDEGFRKYLRTEGIGAVVDATHPFASRISMRTWVICLEEDVSHCQVLRREWASEPDDDWITIDSEEDAAQFIMPGSVVFVATGRQTLDRFANLRECRIICRQIDPPDRAFPYPNGEYLISRPPFGVNEEYCLFKRLNVDWLIAKNAGGNASRTKLLAARKLGIKVAMINRPPQPDSLKMETAEQALDWVESL
ncbi:MAG: cobalt-precorrin-6A reductase [Roseovarius sp.]|nr:cobalt-precorrin-6A reductase [Roseovarius sp.]